MDITALKLQPAKINQFKKKGIETIEQLIDFVPRKYLDYRNPKLRSQFVDGENISVIVRIVSCDFNAMKGYWKAVVEDDAYDRFDIYWFGNVYGVNQITRGERYIFCGKVSYTWYNKKWQMSNPMFSKDIDSLRTIIPVYSKINGMSDAYLKGCINKVLNAFVPDEILEWEIIDKYNLCCAAEKLRYIHQPQTPEDIEIAKKRMVFDELFHLAIEMERTYRETRCPTDITIKTCNWIKPFLDSLPFKLTDGEESQLETVRSIIRKVNKGYLTTSLAQGDVGCGKTFVAILTMLAFAENGYQTVLMAPTTVLATQHYNEICSFVKVNPDIHPVLLTGNLKAKEKREALAKIKSGEANFIVGTHSLISDGVEFSNLGLCIVDEEHRFGVAQRNRIRSKITNGVHTLSMSATPIPRTLGVSLYGEGTDIYTISKMPNGRKPVETTICTELDDAYDFMHKELEAGRQAYIICPLIEESSNEKMSDIESVEETYKNLCKKYENDPLVKIAMVNGKMKQAEVTDIIKRFKDKEFNIVIATTIIEVGVNVPNSTVILIKNAERFGLAQLHQLRGRVGRGSYQSYCILASTKEDVERLEVMTQTTNGFRIAEEDLRLRGMGDFLGTKQSGDVKNVMLMLMNRDLYNDIKSDVKLIFEDQDRYNYYYNAGF